MTAPTLPSLPPLIYEPIVRRALQEDLGRAGDITTDALVPADRRATARVVARKEGRLAGLEPATSAFALLDRGVAIRQEVRDGSDVAANTTLAMVEGPARALLTAERTALNLLGRLSGVATTTRNIVPAIGGTKAHVVCTRKTLPGLRALQKYAVRAGGGSNHRFGLDDAVLIKDNHLAIAGSIELAVQRARASVGHMVKIELEVDTLDQLQQALAVGVDAVLLDNMSTATLRQAVGMARGKAIIEASGGITADTAAAIAATGVDLLSIGWLTHSAPNLDVALDIAPDR